MDCETGQAYITLHGTNVSVFSTFFNLVEETKELGENHRLYVELLIEDQSSSQLKVVLEQRWSSMAYQNNKEIKYILKIVVIKDMWSLSIGVLIAEMPVALGKKYRKGLF